MQPTPFRRALALFLCAQPVFWLSDVALAQTLEQQAIGVQQADQQRLLQSQAGQPLPGDAQRVYPPQPGGVMPGGVVTGQPGGLFATPGTTQPPVATTPGEPDGVRADRPAVPGAIPAATPVDEPVDPDRYILGPGDVLELHFWGIENFRLRVTTDLEGRAFIPKVGYLVLRGKSLTEAQGMLKDSVARYFPKLGFGVNLAEPRTFLVQVVNDVVRPGPQQAKAIDRVATVIARAGGLGPNASKRRIEVKRRDGTVLTSDLLLYTLTGDVKHNPHVLDGDVIRVPFQSIVVTASGAVNRPGKYELTGTTDLAELVSLAGGLAPNATQGLPITLVRRAADDGLTQTLLPFPVDGKLPDQKLQGDDSVWFPIAAELQQSLTVVGAIAGATVTMTGTTPDESSSTRRLPYAKGDTVRTVLERVGGIGPLADLKGAYIVRNGESLPVDLYALVMLRDLSADRPVELGDTLVVPFQRRNVLVEGAVFKPGPYAYNPSYNVEQYLSLAGGLNRFALGIDDVYVVTPQGEMKPYAPDSKVAPGSSVVVPERNFSRSEVVAIILSAVGVLLSGVGIIIAARK
jgi:protein involved in polysaccharide export with SLBB domain